MNIGLLQQGQAKLASTKVDNKQTSLDSTAQYKPKFGEVFNQMIAINQAPQKVEEYETEESTSVKNALVVIETKGLNDLFALLGIEVDAAQLFATVDGELLALDEMLNLEDLAAALNLSTEQLQEVIEQLTGQSAEDIWAIIENMPQLMPELIAALQGHNQFVTPKQANQLIEFLKLAEIIASKSDLTYTQELKLKELKMNLDQMVPKLEEAITKQTTVTKTTMNFQQVLQQVTTVTETKEAPSSQVTQTITTISEPKQVTVTVNLPAEKPAQSEALLKEIQNLINRNQLSNSQGQLKLLLKLFPENLGQIRIELIQKNGVLTARMLASTPLGKELLDSNLNQLKNAFVAHNIQMERIDVAQALQETDRHLRDQSLFSNLFKQQEEEIEEEHEDEDEEKSFSEYLNEEVQV